MKIGICIFPGTNCEKDLKSILERYYNATVDLLWHTESFTIEHDVYFLPGGFSYGDYVRTGALARGAKSLKSIQEAVNKGILVVGICNGFQILTETHLLPGALIKNKDLKHICKWTSLLSNALLHEPCSLGSFMLPISHSSGNYICSPETLENLQENLSIFMEYTTNVNGSIHNIAGICNPNKTKKIVGLMPHPERAFQNNIDIPASKYQYGKLVFDVLFSKI